MHDGGFVGLSNAISEKFRSAPESWSLSDGDLSCMQEAKETCVHRPCHDVVEVLRLFVKKIFDLIGDGALLATLVWFVML